MRAEKYYGFQHQRGAQDESPHRDFVGMGIIIAHYADGGIWARKLCSLLVLIV